MLPPGLKGNKFPQSCRAARLPRGCRTVAALVPQERRTALGRCRASAARVPHVYSTHATQVPRRYHARTHLVRHEAVSFLGGGFGGSGGIRAPGRRQAASKHARRARAFIAEHGSQAPATCLWPLAASVGSRACCTEVCRWHATACTYHRCLRAMIARGAMCARMRVAWPRASPDIWCIVMTLGARARGSP